MLRFSSQGQRRLGGDWMMKMINIAKKFIRRMTRLYLGSLLPGSETKNLLAEDIRRWAALLPADPAPDLASLFFNYPEFRALFYYRTQSRKLSTRLLRFCCPPPPALHICTRDIGPGLFIQHGFATIIAAKSIGRNCWVNQQVTIGYAHAGLCPEIGDDVSINAGALVIGAVTIGDRAVIGAGAVVVKSVPTDCTVVGNPARIIKRNGRRVDEKL